MTPPIFTTAAELRAHLLPHRTKRIALVPTMGALHDGHLELVRRAAKVADHVVVYIFVNPTQFAPHEDFKSYPRNLDRDVELISNLSIPRPPALCLTNGQAQPAPARQGRGNLFQHLTTPSPLAGEGWGGGDISIFTPSVEEIYPTPSLTKIALGDIALRWEGAARPGHFAGVALVLSKFFNLVQPHVALFGEKDFQQLQVVRQFVRDLLFPVEIIGVEIMREASGLAMSSRNAYLTADERSVVAPKLYAALRAAADDIRRGGDVSTILSNHKRDLFNAGFSTVDYFVCVDAETLVPHVTGPVPPGARLLAAAQLGKVRLLDNIAVH